MVGDDIGILFGKNIPNARINEKEVSVDGIGTEATGYMKKFGGVDLTELLGYNPDK